MQIYKNLKELPYFTQPLSFTIGSFDGLHRGHLHLFSFLRRINHCVAAVTYDSLPSIKSSFSLFSLPQKISLFERLGFDFLLLFSFEEICSFSYQDFLLFLTSHFSHLHLVLGKGSVFGKEKEGTEEKVQSFMQQHSLDVEYITKIEEEKRVISSSWIRQELLQGNFSLIEKLLGRPLSFDFFPPFSFINSPLSYPNSSLLHFSWKILSPLPEGRYEVIVEIEKKRCFSQVFVENHHLHLAIPSHFFHKEQPLSIIFAPQEKKEFFQIQMKDMYVENNC